MTGCTTITIGGNKRPLIGAEEFRQILVNSTLGERRPVDESLIRKTKAHTPKAKLILLAVPKAVGYYPKIGMSQWEQCYILDNVEDLK